MRKKKPRVVWLPSDINNRLGSAPLPAATGLASQTIIKDFTANPLGVLPSTEEIPIVKDFSTANASITDAGATLADIEQSGYRLRRIVGKLNFFVSQGVANAAGDGSIFLVTAGFIVRRVIDTGASALSQGAGGLDISTVTFENIMDPWIWRRSWLLSDNTLASVALDPNSAIFPGSNTQYGGGIADGAHVDAKTARVVGPEERLFLSVTVEGVNGNAQGQNVGLVLLIGDLRVLASMRSNTGNRRNASR